MREGLTTMPTLTIRKSDGSNGGSLKVGDTVFGAEPNAYCVRAAVAQYLNAQRAGTHQTKTRAFVSGGGRKPYRQKGTGRARQGSIRATQWRGGATVFGPHPRDYTQSLNKKVKRQALCSVWSDLLRNERLIVVQAFDLNAPKTRDLVALLDRLGVKGTALIVTEKTDPTVALSARNLAWAHAANADNLNVYDLLNHDYVVTTPEVVRWLEATYA
jgi:large subunit ribosomal protein L4